MADNKKSFMFYCDWQETFNTLPNDKAGELIKHVLSYVNDENPKTDDLLINAVFANIKNTLKRDLKKWEYKQTQNSDAGNLSAFNRFKKRIPKDVSKDDLLFEIGYCDKKRIECLKMGQSTKYWDLCLTHLNEIQHNSTGVKNVATKSSVKDTVIVKDNVTVKVINNKQIRFSFRKSLCDLGLEKSLVDDFLKNRKLKRLANTETAFKNLVIEFGKNEIPITELITKIVSNGWGSFKNSWLEKEKNFAPKKEKQGAHEITQQVKQGTYGD